ncbi:peptidase M49-like protein [Anseongella ginsenosidimutans]|uniref:Peptidase M49-like protein n=1 Tax=Anseongella ginsenosidimutans TaxID=496056 RepID=A0A4R3L1Q1_9SPHI|nr:Zn-dependent hydrolase [Anseongella ginsenosidimutans]QEC50996.1 Zn-dependent hydrolase [Anseongella ginsenosidimutans]TCS90352.1 peptidase M49-like protein [Anseongella ginsenosidimutans]
MKKPYILLAGILLSGAFSCEKPGENMADDQNMQEKLEQYVSVRLTADLSGLSGNQREMIPLLIEAAKVMDSLFWREAYGDPDSLLNSLEDEATREYVRINYGPWDRLDNNAPFIEGIGEKPEGANFYPEDMTKEEFEQADLPGKDSLYTVLRRDNAGELYTIPYHELFSQQVQYAAGLLEKAAALAEDEGLKKYLELRAEALRTDRYRRSDLAWMDMKDNTIEVVIGPIETYEDRLFGYKAAHEAYVLLKDREWSERLEKYAAYLPELQQNLPVEDRYKQEKPGSDADLNAYDVIYYAGDCNAGSKTIAINLPNDEQVQLQKGTRRLQLKNAMQAKFDKIMLPITGLLIDSAQRANVTFDAFFANTMFHEVAHGLGIKNTLTDKGTVREALKEHASALEEGKADILGLYMIMQLLEKNELEGSPEDYMTTFMAGIFRSVRFGASSAHGVANMIRFNYFREQDAFQRLANGTYRVDYAKMKMAADSLSRLILTLQGNGDYAGVAKLVEEKGRITPQLQSDLDRLGEAGIPVDVVFEQGVEVLGL